MEAKKLADLYLQRGFSKEQTNKAQSVVLSLEKYLLSNDANLEDCSIDNIKEYISVLLSKGEIPLETLMAIARYFYVINRHDVYIYFTKLLGGIGVLDNIKKRMIKYSDQDTANKVLRGYKYPPLGTPIEDVPIYTKELMRRIKENISPEVYKKILAGNNHGIPEASMQDEKEYYKKASSLEQYLAERHARNVNELQEYCDANKVWYEQEITQTVVDYVKSNQEILSAVKRGNKLYVTKIPYDTASYLNSKSDNEKDYYACHCSFAREAILSDEENVPEDWCYCSAGFAKYPFEVILEKELDVKVLNTALGGDGYCRFEIDLGTS